MWHAGGERYGAGMFEVMKDAFKDLQNENNDLKRMVGQEFKEPTVPATTVRPFDPWEDLAHGQREFDNSREQWGKGLAEVWEENAKKAFESGDLKTTKSTTNVPTSTSSTSTSSATTIISSPTTPTTTISTTTPTTTISTTSTTIQTTTSPTTTSTTTPSTTNPPTLPIFARKAQSYISCLQNYVTSVKTARKSPIFGSFTNPYRSCEIKLNKSDNRLFSFNGKIRSLIDSVMSKRSPDKIKIFRLKSGKLGEIKEDELCDGYGFDDEQGFFVAASEPEIVLV